MATFKLTTTSDTVFKQSVLDSSKLTADKKISIKAGQEFTLLAYSDLDNSWKVTLKDVSLAPPGAVTSFNTWYVYKGHVTLLDDSPIVEIPRGACFNVEGFKFPIYFDKPIYPGSNFKWSEALHYNPVTGYYRKPTKAIVENIIDMAKRMDWVRVELGNYPITISSWYRDPVSNARAGGASKSWHMLGKAVDFQSTKYTPEQVRARIRSKWVGGCELAIPWCHLDDGPDRDFYP